MSKTYCTQNMETENHRTGIITRKEPCKSIMFVKVKEIVSHAKTQFKIVQVLKCRAKIRTTHVPTWMHGF